MSPVDPPVPPAGEEIHLPGGSLQPLLITVALTLILVGVTVSDILLVAGGVLFVWTMIQWLIDAKREFDHLPSDHAPH